MRGRAARIGATTLVVLLAGGCGVVLDLDPRPPPATAFDAGGNRGDGGRRDGGGRDAGPDDAGAMVDGFVRECASNTDCLDPCRTGRTCGADGRCTAGAPLACDDGDYCTDDSCGAMGCKHVRPAADPCDDGDGCTTELCTGGPDATSACVVVDRMLCDDGVSCTLDSCDPAGGLCVAMADDSLCPHSPVGDPGTCDPTLGCQYPSCSAATCVSDGCANATCVGDVCMRTPLCTSGQTCCAGECVPARCDDGNPCTGDTCGLDGCVSVPLADGRSCPIINLCSRGGTCSAGMCVSIGERACDDGNPCTADGCDPSTGACTRDTSTTDGMACDDGTACTTDDACASGRCTGGASPCDMSDRCKPVACMPTAGGHTCDPLPIPVGARCGAQMVCNASGDCVCDMGLVDCDGDGRSCECRAAGCVAGLCASPIDPCATLLCGVIACCPTTGECYVPTCTACCPPPTT